MAKPMNISLFRNISHILMQKKFNFFSHYNINVKGIHLILPFAGIGNEINLKEVKI